MIKVSTFKPFMISMHLYVMIEDDGRRMGYADVDNNERPTG